MRVVIFCHSLVSDWNHGNAHFLRGVLRELIALGHEVVAYEPEDAWSLTNLLADHGESLYECATCVGHGDNLTGMSALTVPLAIRMPRRRFPAASPSCRRWSARGFASTAWTAGSALPTPTRFALPAR